jgi:hypothetical protein
MKLNRKLEEKTRETEQAINISLFFVSEKPKLPDNFQTLTWDKLAESVQPFFLNFQSPMWWCMGWKNNSKIFS